MSGQGRQDPTMSDERAAVVIAAVLELAVTLRDEVGPAVADTARAALAAAGGDPVAALTVAAALIRVDAPLDVWWQPGRSARSGPAPCGTPSAYRRHTRRGEDPDGACIVAYRASERDRKRARRAAA